MKGIDASGTTGTHGTGAIVDNGYLYSARTDALTVASTISGSGRVEQHYGVLTLTGDHTVA